LKGNFEAVNLSDIPHETTCWVFAWVHRVGLHRAFLCSPFEEHE